MKLRNKIAAITAAAMLAFTGVGFAAWTFTKELNSNAQIETKVTAAIEAKDLKVKAGTQEVTKLYLICDAPSDGTGLVAGNGLYWSTENSNDVSKKVESLTLVGSVNEADHDITDITKYVGHFASTATSAVSGTWVNIAATTALNQDVTSTSKNSDVEYVWNLPAVSYAKVPTSVAEVTALQTEVAALSLTFAFTFNVKSIA